MLDNVPHIRTRNIAQYLNNVSISASLNRRNGKKCVWSLSSVGQRQLRDQVRLTGRQTTASSEDPVGHLQTAAANKGVAGMFQESVESVRILQLVAEHQVARVLVPVGFL